MHRMVRKHGVRVAGISQVCHAALTSHSWPGNVRELQNVIERAVILCPDGEELQPEHLGFVPSGMGSKTGASSGTTPAATATFPVVAASGGGIVALDEVEKQHILRALEICDGNRTQAAKQLGISIRTLRNKLHEYGFGKDDSGGDESESQANA